MSYPFPCDFQPSVKGGHWHKTKQEAEICIEKWKAWSNVWNRTKGDMNPHREPTLDYGVFHNSSF